MSLLVTSPSSLLRHLRRQGLQPRLRRIFHDGLESGMKNFSQWAGVWNKARLGCILTMVRAAVRAPAERWTEGIALRTRRFGADKSMCWPSNELSKQARVMGFWAGTQLRGIWNFDRDQNVLSTIELAKVHGLGSTQSGGTGAAVRRNRRNVDHRHRGRTAAIAAICPLPFLQPCGCRRSGPGLPRSSPEQEGVAARSREAAQLAVLDSQQFLSHAAAFRSAAWANVADRGFRGQPRGIGLAGRSAISSRSRPRDGQALRRTSSDFAPSERRRIWHQEVADTLGIPIGTVMSRLAR